MNNCNCPSHFRTVHDLIPTFLLIARAVILDGFETKELDSSVLGDIRAYLGVSPEPKGNFL